MPGVAPDDVDLDVHPTDDEAAGWDDANGVEKCPLCGTLYSGNAWYTDGVYEPDGTFHDHYLDSDPGDGPFYCAPCWEAVTVARQKRANASLGAFVEGDDG